MSLLSDLDEILAKGRKAHLSRLPYLGVLAIQSKGVAIQVINEGLSRVKE